MSENQGKTKVAVVTGRHPFDVINFEGMFRSMPDTDCYVQNLEAFVSSPEEVRLGYQVVLFYNFHQQTPTGEIAPWVRGELDSAIAGILDKPMKGVLEQLGTTDQGIFVLHHAILAFPEWPLWAELVGIADRKFGYYPGENLHFHVAKSDHPITQGLDDWDAVDETYTMRDAAEGSDVLLTVDHPRSMKTIGWTRQYGKSRVFCLELGHDNLAFADPNFRTIVHRGLKWCARSDV